MLDLLYQLDVKRYTGRWIEAEDALIHCTGVSVQQCSSAVKSTTRFGDAYSIPYCFIFR
jgi:hypothetical protein